MARIPLREPDDADIDPRAQALLTAIQSIPVEPGAPGPLLNMHRVLANHGDLMEKVFALLDTAYFSNSLPTARQRELPFLTSALVNNCFY